MSRHLCHCNIIVNQQDLLDLILEPSFSYLSLGTPCEASLSWQQTEDALQNRIAPPKGFLTLTMFRMRRGIMFRMRRGVDA